MLGDLFYEATGRITSKRVLDLERLEIESSYFVEGKMREIEVFEIGTFTSLYDRNKRCFIFLRQGYCNC